MARIPDAVQGLIFRYGYLWVADSLRNRNDPAKDRPACIVMRVESVDDPSLATVNRSAISPGDVIILPITTQPPTPTAVAIELTSSEKRLCGLDSRRQSWVIVSEFNADTWPNADIMPVPETGQFKYGVASPGLVRRIARAFSEARRNRRVVGVKR